MNIAIACGGTGGHVFPGLATARELLKRGHEVTLWLTGRDTEMEALKDWDGPVVTVPARGFPSGISWRSVKAAWGLVQAVWRCRRAMRQDRPDVLLAMGSYASVGPCGAARLLGVPIVLHEANVVPGRAVKLFAKSAVAVAGGFEETRYHLPGIDLTVAGIPLREELTEAANGFMPRIRDMHIPLRLLVAGGSLGARNLNLVVSDAVTALKKEGMEIEVTHLTGREDEIAMREKYEAADVPAKVIAFTKFMAELYYHADLAISRAGAMTCAELSYFRVPALLVPYPLAAGDHQMANARALERRAMVDVADEADLTAEWLQAYLTQTIRQPERLTRMRDASRREGLRNGTSQLADLVESCVNETKIE